MKIKIKTCTLHSPFSRQRKTLIWRRHCSIGQSCCSTTSKRSIHWFLESSRAWSIFTRAFASLTNQKPRALYPFDKPIKLLYFRLFVVSVLFARFHFKIIRKSLLLSRHCLPVLAPIYSLPCYSNTCLHCTKVWHAFVARNLSDMRRTLHFRGWHSAVSEIARKSSPYCVWIEALFGLVFVSAQKLSGILWT